MICQLGLNQGGLGLLQRVQPYLHLADGGVFDLTQADESLPWAETLDALNNAEQVLSKMHEQLNGDNATNSPSQAGKSMFDEDDDSASMNSNGSFGDVPPYANNVRVKVILIN